MFFAILNGRLLVVFSYISERVMLCHQPGSSPVHADAVPQHGQPTQGYSIVNGNNVDCVSCNRMATQYVICQLKVCSVVGHVLLLNLEKAIEIVIWLPDTWKQNSSHEQDGTNL